MAVGYKTLLRREGLMKISNPRIYDMLKFLAQIVLPVLGALYFGLAGSLDLPERDQVVGFIVVVDAVLGVLLQISSSKYSSKNVGEIEMTELPSGGKTYSLNLVGHPEDLELYDEVRFAVSKGTTLAKPSDWDTMNTTPLHGRARRKPRSVRGH
jgi:hypothetical protein